METVRTEKPTDPREAILADLRAQIRAVEDGRPIEHDTHLWERVDVGPPKMFTCKIQGCPARASVHPVTKGPDLRPTA